jgi:hypothetical protein
MIKCPMCNASNDDDARQCRRCQADLALLADYVSHLQGGLTQADALTRAGELGEAVWAYLAVLEIDPDNATARRQVGKVVTAVRQFDETAPGRRWLTSLRKQSWWRRWLAGSDQGASSLLPAAVGCLLLFLSLVFAYSWGYYAGLNAHPPMLSVDEAEKAQQEKQAREREEAQRKQREELEKKERKQADDAGLRKTRRD